MKQLTIAELVEQLSSFPSDKQIDALECAHSYRGYYDDIAFESNGRKQPANEVMNYVISCIGQQFEGYKGGTYTMDKNTHVWLSTEGLASGNKLTGYTMKGEVVCENVDF